MADTPPPQSDMELAGEKLAAGDSVMVGFAAANTGPARRARLKAAADGVSS
ncbi:hypothetical protein [Streptomyces sp. NPDC046712]|uniref:hypothetical protein n=1 Tax=Streptomyces sp. NPDC046712 TaxID=3154802 RepID=UPI0033E49B8C